MNAILPPIIRYTGLLAGAVLILSGFQTYGADPAIPSDSFPVFDSYVKISGQAPDITGNKAAYEARTQQPYNGGAGIEDLHYSKDLTKDDNLVIDGHALFGAADYLGQFHLSKNEVGSFEVGYKSFRTFYDGVGGFFPVNKEWMPMNNENLHTDRSKFWVEGTINQPNMPVLTLKYTNELRDGTKDSTIWGDTDLTGLPLAIAPNPVSPVRKIVPSYLQLDERHQSLEASVKHTVGNTTFQLTLLGDRTDNLDTRYVTRFPGEVIPWSAASLSTTVPQTSRTGISPQNAAKALLGPTNWNNQVLLQQSDGIQTKTSAITGKIDTVLNDKLTFHLGGSYQLLHSDITGERPLITSTPTSTGMVPVTTDTFTGLTGSSRVKVYTGSAAIDYKPVPDLFIKVAVRAEDEYIHGASRYNVVALPTVPVGTPATTVYTVPRVDWAKINQRSATPVVELRYTGIKNLSLYFTGSKRNLDGDERNASAYNPMFPNGTTATTTAPSNSAVVLANNNLAEDHGNYTLGANWRTCSMLTLRAEAFDKHHQYESAGFGVNLGDYYQVDSQFKGLKLTGIVKPLAELTLTSRYVYQTGTMQVTGFLPTYPAYDSCDAKNFNFGETVDWVPNKAIYVQLNGNVVFNKIGTIYPRAGITPAVSTTYTTSHATVVTARAYDTGNVLHNSNNNYVTASALAGFIVSKQADVQIQYTYYKADNGDAAMAAFTQPYGAASQESMVTAGIKYKVSARMVVNAKLGYLDSNNDTTGGNTNFHGPLGYVSLDYAL